MNLRKRNLLGKKCEVIEYNFKFRQLVKSGSLDFLLGYLHDFEYGVFYIRQMRLMAGEDGLLEAELVVFHEF